MSEQSESHPPVAVADRRAELRVPATTLGDVRSRLVGGSEFSLLNYTAQSLYGSSRSRLLVGSRISVRLATATLNSIVTGRVVRSSLTAVTDGVPSYEVAVSLEHPVDWSPEAMPVEASNADPDEPEAVPVRAAADARTPTE